ncbi:uncharacterized protein BJ171DRAFT_489861 [Polychytrium aggregatum]|uniref:uncharacterized protein n=1 Tax=Polychytrium aggregatum TaxID=110093 RepID=UPI0022FDD673|nr:uncharacterized protein BJ171DRAFT_489861 [Polychytrium aggregatum]KAI9208747.1 hypothetical protein BJ171DRAFT_489861 [Polychytrium aggregatum]
MSSSTIQNPQDVLLAASGAVAAKDYSKAAALFTELMERWPQIPKQLPMLSRSTCFMETKEYSKALSDVIAVLQQEDVQVAEEIIPNCFSTRVAAATRAAQIYTALKDNEKATLYKKLATELVELSAHTADQAQQLKEEGNGFYKQSRLREALERYQKALKLDPANASILGNITQTLIRLDRLTDARQYANRCAAVQPEWPKAWYRKGMIELKLGNLVDALSAFQQGLAHAPDDVDLKRIYLETSKKAEKASPAKGGLDQHFLGMMMDLRHNSWSVAEWFKTQSAHIQYWDMSRFDPASYAAAQNSARFKSIVTRIASFASNSFQQGLSAEVGLSGGTLTSTSIGSPLKGGEYGNGS